MHRINRNFLFVYIFIANILDAIMTDYSVGSGLAWELNPLMRHLLETSVFYFYACKITLVTLGLSLLARTGQSRFTHLAICFCAAVYTLILALHLRIIL